MIRRINDVIGGIFPAEMRDQILPVHLDRFCLVEQLYQIGTGPIIRVHCTQKRHRREFTALVNPDTQRVALADDDLDPASSLGDHSAGKLLTLTRLGTLNEVHSW